jgi:hypothetical protein
MKNIKIELPQFITALALIAICIGTALGKIQQTIHFSGALNELAFFGFCGVTAILLFISSISLEKK